MFQSNDSITHFGGAEIFVVISCGNNLQALISIQKIVLIGTGRVATQVGLALHKAGLNIVQVYGRNLSTAAILAEKLKCTFTSDLIMIDDQADLYLLAISDDAIEIISENLKAFQGIVAHTSGFQPLSAIHQKIPRRGVFYPLQTFSYDRYPCFDEIPFFVEATSNEDTELLLNLAGKLSSTVVRSNSQQRRQLHLAAVFVCNFSNAMYDIGNELIKSNKLDFGLLKPLIKETADKINHFDPSQAQTGPARRNDSGVLKAHHQMLEQNTHITAVYAAVTNYLLDKYHQTDYEQL